MAAGGTAAYGGSVTQPLLEREAELQVVARRLDAVPAGQGALLVIEGPAGIGKTSLLEAAAEAARARGMAVLRARGAVLEQTFSFGVAHQLLERVRASRDPAEWRTLTAGRPASPPARSTRRRRTQGPGRTPGTPRCTASSG